MRKHKLRISKSERPSNTQVKTKNELGNSLLTSIAGEYPLTIYVNKTPLVTLMTMGQEPEALSLGYLLNQGLISSPDDVKAITVDWETNASAVVLNDNIEIRKDLLDEKIVTSGCGQGTMFGSLMEKIEKINLNTETTISKNELYRLLQIIRSEQTVYKTSGAVHGCALLQRESIIYLIEDVGRHNAVDAIAGKMLMDGINGSDKYFYTTGRLTSEMVIKCAQMQIPILISRSGVTHMGWKIADQVQLTIIARATGKHFLLFTGENRFSYD